MDVNVTSLQQRAKVEAKSYLEQLLNEGARKLLQAAKNEVAVHLQSQSGRRSESGERSVVRNGHLRVNASSCRHAIFWQAMHQSRDLRYLYSQRRLIRQRIDRIRYLEDEGRRSLQVDDEQTGSLAVSADLQKSRGKPLSTQQWDLAIKVLRLARGRWGINSICIDSVQI
jgi:hypothetical protein